MKCLGVAIEDTTGQIWLLLEVEKDSLPLDQGPHRRRPSSLNHSLFISSNLREAPDSPCNIRSATGQVTTSMDWRTRIVAHHSITTPESSRGLSFAIEFSPDIDGCWVSRLRTNMIYPCVAQYARSENEALCAQYRLRYPLLGSLDISHA